LFHKAIIAAVLATPASPAAAGGWSTVHRYVHRTGNCEGTVGHLNFLRLRLLMFNVSAFVPKPNVRFRG
jgi:hypothetical protein